MLYGGGSSRRLTCLRFQFPVLQGSYREMSKIMAEKLNFRLLETGFQGFMMSNSLLYGTGNFLTLSVIFETRQGIKGEATSLAAKMELNHRTQ